MDYTCYTDGAYSSVRDQGGIGIIFLKNGEEVLRYSNMYKGTSNNQMELGAIIIALRMIKGKIDYPLLKQNIMELSLVIHLHKLI